MENTESRLYFASDYMEGAHPAIMKKLMETNLEKTVGYGQDPYTEDAKEKIRKACNAPEADVFLLAVPAGERVGKRLEAVLEYLHTQDCSVNGAFLWNADEQLICSYYFLPGAIQTQNTEHGGEQA